MNSLINRTAIAVANASNNNNNGGMVQSGQQIQQSHQACIKCKGNGFVHESSMTHDKDINQKCFFCNKCQTCDGSGVLINQTTTQIGQQPVMNNGMTMNGQTGINPNMAQPQMVTQPVVSQGMVVNQPVMNNGMGMNGQNMIHQNVTQPRTVIAQPVFNNGFQEQHFVQQRPVTHHPGNVNQPMMVQQQPAAVPQQQVVMNQPAGMTQPVITHQPNTLRQAPQNQGPHSGPMRTHCTHCQGRGFINHPNQRCQVCKGTGVVSTDGVMDNCGCIIL